MHVALVSRTGFECTPATAGYIDCIVCRVYFCFHNIGFLTGLIPEGRGVYANPVYCANISTVLEVKISHNGSVVGGSFQPAWLRVYPACRTLFCQRDTGQDMVYA